MVVLGLTGGIASGKSTVARQIVAAGAVHVDADRIAREVVEPGTPGLASVLHRFGQDLRLPDGHLDRKRLGALVFADPKARADLEALLHPLILQRIAQHLDAARTAGKRWVLLDVALLFELNLQQACDVLLVVACPPEVQVARIVARDGLGEAAAWQRVRSQLDDGQRQARAQASGKPWWQLDNVGTLADLTARVDQVLAQIAARFGPVMPP